MQNLEFFVLLPVWMFWVAETSESILLHPTLLEPFSRWRTCQIYSVSGTHSVDFSWHNPRRRYNWFQNLCAINPSGWLLQLIDTSHNNSSASSASCLCCCNGSPSFVHWTVRGISSPASLGKERPVSHTEAGRQKSGEVRKKALHLASVLWTVQIVRQMIRRFLF